jgi:hypothetical protein
MLRAAATNFRPAGAALDLLVNDKYRTFFQRFRQHLLQDNTQQDAESYASSTDFLLSAGGIPTGAAYNVLGNTKSDDYGLVENTIVIPRAEFLSVKEMIRFDNKPHEAGMCVTKMGATYFACGVNTKVPENYLRDFRCYIRAGHWTFIDATGPCKEDPNPSHTSYGFFVAVYNAIPNIDSPPKDPQFGFVEVVPVSAFSSLGIGGLSDYLNLTLRLHNQAGVDFTSGSGTFIAADNTKLQFDFNRDGGEAPFLSSQYGPTWDGADGPISQGASNRLVVTITLPGNASPTVIMNFADSTNPICAGCWKGAASPPAVEARGGRVRAVRWCGRRGFEIRRGDDGR